MGLDWAQSNGYLHGFGIDNNPLNKWEEAKKNKTARKFPIICTVAQCIWHKDSSEGGLGNCDRSEAWNLLSVEELSMDDKEDCPWYSGRSRGHKYMTRSAFPMY